MTAAAPFRVVVFDCDSTLSGIEGVDELARMRGLGDEVSRLTSAAMLGELPLEQVYQRRLELIRPDAGALQWLGRRYVEEQVRDAAETIRILQALGKDVHIISGGFLQAVQALGRALNIAESNVHAVRIDLDAAGNYRTFDRHSPLTRSGGKAQVCAGIAGNGGQVVAVGDGMTDLEMRDCGARVIAFGGVVDRPAVRERADGFVAGPSLLDVLSHVLRPGERARAGSG